MTDRLIGAIVGGAVIGVAAWILLGLLLLINTVLSIWWIAFGIVGSAVVLFLLDRGE